MAKNQKSEDDISRVQRTIQDARDWSIISAIFASIGIIFTFWALSAHEHNINNASLGPITFSLALLQTLLAVMAFGGFWILKGAAVNAGQKAGRSETREFLQSEEFERILRSEVQTSDAQALIREVVTDWLDTNGYVPTPSDEAGAASSIADSLDGGSNG